MGGQIEFDPADCLSPSIHNPSYSYYVNVFCRPWVYFRGLGQHGSLSVSSKCPVADGVQ